MEARLKTRIRVQALMRLAENHGGSAMVLHRGDDSAGDLMLVMIERTKKARLFRREPGRNFNHVWVETTIQDDAAPDAPERLDRFAGRDPDLWIIEISVPHIQQFIAEADFAA